MCPAASKLELLTPTLSVMVRGGWGGFGHEGRAVPSSRCDDPHLILSKRSLAPSCWRRRSRAHMKRTSWLINASHGPTVDEGALECGL